ncbi:MAG: hypothetical protein RXQ00_06480 [Caldivirga sp.]
MCRMAIILGGMPSVLNVREGVVNGLIKAASNDPYGERLYGESSHSDGWGFVSLVTGNPTSPSMFKSLKPIYLDPLSPKILLSVHEGHGTLIEMIHARAASTGTPKNMTSTHPVHSITNTGHEVFMIHNGSFRRDDLARYLNLGPSYGASYNDTFIANLALAGRVSDGITVEDLKWLLGYVKTGANLGILMVKYMNGQLSEVQLVVGSYYVKANDGKDAARDDYYRLYWCSGNGINVYASSTIVDYYRPVNLPNCTPLRNGEYHSYMVNANTGEYTREVWMLS